MAMTYPPLRRAGLCLLGACLATLAQASEREHAIDEVLMRALSANPSVRATQAQAQAAHQDVDVAKLGRWPTIQIGAEANTNSTSTGTVLVVEQPLWSAGAISARIAEAQKQAEVSEAQVDVSRNQIGLRVIDAWQSWMETNASIEVYQRVLQEYERYQAMMRRRVDAQVSAAIEMELLASRTLQARVDVNEARALRRVALSRLEQILGEPLDEATQAALSTTLPASEVAPLTQVAALEQLLLNLQQHPSVRRATHETAVAGERLRQQRAQSWPQVVARYRRQLSGTVTSGTDREQFALALNYAPGAGFSSYARANADAQRLQGLELAAESVQQDLTEQMRVEWEALRREVDRQAVQDQAIDSGREVLASYERQFVAGRKSWLDVLNALREVTQSEIRLVQAKASATASFYRLRLRSGVLPGDNEWKVQP